MLELQELYLDGWMGYDKVTIQLNKPGVTVIKGPVGSGKSVILEAIIYLLYGVVIRKKDSVNSLVNKILDNGFEIWLKFRINEKVCMIKEVRDRKDGGLFFEIDGKPKLGKTNGATRKLIIDKLGMDVGEFKSIAFLGQKQSQSLVEGTSGDRGACIIDIFNMQKYAEYVNNCSKDVEQALGKEKALQESVETYNADLTELEASLKFDPIEGVDEKALDKIKKNIAVTEEKLKKIRERKTSCDNEISSQEALQKQQEKLKELREEIKTIETKLSNVDNPDCLISDLERSLVTHRANANTVSSDVKRLNSKLKQIDSMENKCPITKEECPTNVPNDYKSVRKDECTKELTKAENEKADLASKLSEAEAIYASKKTYSNLSDQLDSKVKTLKTFDNSIDIVDVSETKLERDKCTDGLLRGTSYLEKLRDQKTDIVTKQALIKQRQELQTKVENTIQEKKKQIVEYERQLELGSEEIKYLSAALHILKKCKLYKIDIVLDLINRNVQEQLDQISRKGYTAYFSSQKQDSKGKRTLDDLNLMVSDGYKTLPIGLWSGGQIAQIGLSVLLGVWKSAHELSGKHVNCLFMDEPFGPLDDFQVDEVFGAIIELYKHIGASSVKIISHRDLDETKIDHVWRTKQVNGISQLEM